MCCCLFWKHFFYAISKNLYDGTLNRLFLSPKPLIAVWNQYFLLFQMVSNDNILNFISNSYEKLFSFVHKPPHFYVVEWLSYLSSIADQFPGEKNQFWSLHLFQKNDYKVHKISIQQLKNNPTHQYQVFFWWAERFIFHQDLLPKTKPMRPQMNSVKYNIPWNKP